MSRVIPCDNILEYYPDFDGESAEHVKMNRHLTDHLCILREVPYIEARCVCQKRGQLYTAHLVLSEGNSWGPEAEDFFYGFCLRNKQIRCNDASLDRIYEYYNKKYPEWHLKRYHTRGMRLLDHIYHCFHRNTAQEILYKAGLDELAERIPDLGELNLLAAKPSEIYDGLSVRVLRALNCEAGAGLLSEKTYRTYLLELQSHFPDIFGSSFNDSQCMYLKHLIDGGLTPGETGRLFRARKQDLRAFWEPYLYGVYVTRTESIDEYERISKEVGQIDPIFKQYFSSLKTNEAKLASHYRVLQYCLLTKREEFDQLLRRVNRKHDESWQERDGDYIVRYPQTIRDFCREAIYMRNCLLLYADSIMHDHMTILFIRKKDDVNKPFITMEIQGNELKQAYHRYNKDCTKEEAAWIIAYCEKHGISTGQFHFDYRRDLLL